MAGSLKLVELGGKAGCSTTGQTFSWYLLISHSQGKNRYFGMDYDISATVPPKRKKKKL